MDKRWKQLADILVNYSTEVQPGQRVMIAMGEVESFPLVQAVYEAAIKAGGFPQVQFLSETLRHALLRYGSDEQLAWVPEIEAHGMEWADVYIGLRGAHNLYEHADIAPARLAQNQYAQGKISSLRWHRTRWCLVRVPNEAFAHQVETNLETAEDMFFDACLLDWRQASGTWQAIAGSLEGSRRVQIIGKNTDISFSVEGRRWVVLDGRLNMPDGEIMTAPVNSTLNGRISFEAPGVFGGRLIDNITLAWHDGRLVEATSSTHQDYLHAVLASDAGASLLGEFAFGTNPHLTRFSRDILLDEKIRGTIHIALGRAYPECGGTNSSAIHWDIVKDLRQEGTVYVDGKPVLSRGEFVI